MTPGKPYRPATGTEGAAFQAAWCDRCGEDARFTGDDTEDGCQILADMLANRARREWVYDASGRPCCTSFQDNPANPSRCRETCELFGDEG